MSLVSQGIVADVQAQRRALIDRFVAADALSPQCTLALSTESLSSDEQSLLEDFVARGTVVAFRGEYYLGSDAVARDVHKSTARAFIGTVVLIVLVGAMVWYVSARS